MSNSIDVSNCTVVLLQSELDIKGFHKSLRFVEYTRGCIKVFPDRVIIRFGRATLMLTWAALQQIINEQIKPFMLCSVEHVFRITDTETGKARTVRVDFRKGVDFKGA